MGLKWSRLDLKRIGKEKDFRMDHEVYLGEKKFNEFVNNFKDVVPLGIYISEITNGQDVSQSVYTNRNTGILYLSVNQISSGLFGEVNLTDAKLLDIKLNDVKVKVEPEDILMTRSGTSGVAWLATKEFLDEWYIVVPSGYLQRIRVADIDPEFLVAYLNLPPVRMLTTSYACGKDQVNLSQEYIKQIPIPVLPREKEREFVKLARKIQGIMREGRKIIKQLENLYQSCAYDILSGGALDINTLNSLETSWKLPKLEYTDQREKWKLPRRRGTQPFIS